ncbi:MAG: TonB-dependent receptor plug domain-containing protein, partial [Myxococcales bacterium]|nr:TonB-dependent receptor plug domain-containing protein [Myxococcales bacterium]
ATVLIVDAPADVRPGKTARDPLDPSAVAWMLQAESDEDGNFAISEVPVGKVRVVVIAAGYRRLEQWAEIEPIPTGVGEQLTLHLVPEADGDYRTRVVSDNRANQVNPPTNVLDGQQARHYAGSGDDALLAALNLPGVARTPGGLGVLAFRGAAPTWTGYYLDGHPIPRGFHIIPVASVVAPTMVDRIEFDPGNYGAGYGGFGGGLVRIESKAARRDGVHGQVHADLFDLGGAITAPVGPGSVAFGARRSHVDGVINTAQRIADRATRNPNNDLSNILIPTYWDYLGRYDTPVGTNQTLTLRALGAGDNLASDDRGRGPEGFAFRNSFHRFDLDYRSHGENWRALLSPSVRFDQARLESRDDTSRNATVLSVRMQYQADFNRWLSLETGSDLVYEFSRRRYVDVMVSPLGAKTSVTKYTHDETLKLGLWLTPTLRLGDWQLVPALRLGLYSVPDVEYDRAEPRLYIRGQVHPKLELLARLVLYSAPEVILDQSSNARLIFGTAPFFGGIADIPSY